MKNNNFQLQFTHYFTTMLITTQQDACKKLEINFTFLFRIDSWLVFRIFGLE